MDKLPRKYMTYFTYFKLLTPVHLIHQPEPISLKLYSTLSCTDCHLTDNNQRPQLRTKTFSILTHCHIKNKPSMRNRVSFQTSLSSVFLHSPSSTVPSAIVVINLPMWKVFCFNFPSADLSSLSMLGSVL